MVVPSALRVVRLKPGRKVRYFGALQVSCYTSRIGWEKGREIRQGQGKLVNFN